MVIISRSHCRNEALVSSALLMLIIWDPLRAIVILLKHNSYHTTSLLQTLWWFPISVIGKKESFQ